MLAQNEISTPWLVETSAPREFHYSSLPLGLFGASEGRQTVVGEYRSWHAVVAELI